MNKAIFLDRDGTINVEVNYLHEPEKFQFIPNAPEALKLLQNSGFKLIIVTNQGAIAKGLYELKDMELTNNFMVDQLKVYGVTIDAIYYCPHRAEDNCNCRKPAPGMILQAIEDFKIDPSQSWTIGDKLSDTEAGFRANTFTLLVFTGYGAEEYQKLGDQSLNSEIFHYPNKTASDLWEAAQFIAENNNGLIN